MSAPEVPHTEPPQASAPQPSYGLPISCLLWLGAWGAIFLPVLSHCGYGPLELEFLVAALFCAVLAVLCALISRFRWVMIVLLLLVVATNTLLYFGDLVAKNIATSLVYELLLLGFLLFTRRSPRSGLRMAGIVGAAQVLSALISTPPQSTTIEWPAPIRQGPSLAPVLHIVLDEHTGLGVIPATPECQSLAARITELYRSRGFLIFTHAYSEHATTRKSLPFFLNPMTMPEQNIEFIDGRSFIIKESYVFKQAGKFRNIDATFLTEMDLTPALKTSGALRRTHHYSTHAGQGKAAAYFQLAEDRLALVQWTVLNWFYQGNHAPLIGPLVNALPISPFFKKHMKEPPPTTFLGGMELSLFRERLSREASTSTYYFGHFLIPHHPYCLDENGALISRDHWGGILLSSPYRQRSVAERDARYALHLGQALYADKQIAKIADDLDRKFSQTGNIILVHSDHGSRLTIPVGTPAESAWAWERFSRNCFLAVRIPGVPGGVIDRPVSMDRLLNHLAKRNFTSLVLDEIPDAESNPFALP